MGGTDSNLDSLESLASCAPFCLLVEKESALGWESNVAVTVRYLAG